MNLKKKTIKTLIDIINFVKMNDSYLLEVKQSVQITSLVSIAQLTSTVLTKVDMKQEGEG